MRINSTECNDESEFHDRCPPALHFPSYSRLWRLPQLLAVTATNGAKLPPRWRQSWRGWRQSALGRGANRRWAVAPIGAGRWRQSALGDGANRRWAVAPIGARRWRQSALGGGANWRWAVAPWRKSGGKTKYAHYLLQAGRAHEPGAG